MILTRRMSRIAALAFGLTFYVTAGIDVLGLHECPHHDAVAMAGEHAGPVEDGGHAAHGAAMHATSAPTDHEDQHGPCTCVGSCHLGGQALTGPVARGIVARGPAPVWTVAPLAGSDGALLPGAPAFLLPFPNAPPGLPTQSV